MLMKILSNVIVVIINYVLSKNIYFLKTKTNQIILDVNSFVRRYINCEKRKVSKIIHQTFRIN